MVWLICAQLVLPTFAVIVLASGQAVAQDHVHKAGLAHDVPDFAVNPTARAVRSGRLGGRA